MGSFISRIIYLIDTFITQSNLNDVLANAILLFDYIFIDLKTISRKKERKCTNRNVKTGM